MRRLKNALLGASTVAGAAYLTAGTAFAQVFDGHVKQMVDDSVFGQDAIAAAVATGTIIAGVTAIPFGFRYVRKMGWR